MSSTVFVDYQTVIPASWLNDVNNLVYNGTVPATTFTMTNAVVNGTLSGTGVSTYLASPPAIGGTAANAITGTTITANTQFTGAGTGLTGTAASLSIGGNAATVTNGVYTTGTYANPSWITSLAGSKVTSIPNSSLTNSSITINGSTVSLGGSTTVTATATNSLTIGTGLSGTSYNGSSAVTIALATTAVTAASYGSASSVGTFTVDAYGRLTAAATTAIAIANTQVSGLGTMSTQDSSAVSITGGSISGIKLVVTGTGGWSSSNFGKQFLVYGTSSNPAIGIFDGNGANPYTITNNFGELVFSRMPAITDSTTAPAERMRIDSSGNLLVGTTTANGVGGATFNKSMNATGDVTWVNNWSISGATHASFRTNGTQNGSITTIGSTTNFNTSSDYRLKENIQPMTGALEKVAQLKPCTYTWKTDGSDGQGFIAHELQEVVPECVTGEKDAIETVDIKDEEGNIIGTEERPVYQGIDTSFLVATLTAAIKELNAKVDAQAAEIAALKAK